MSGRGPAPSDHLQVIPTGHAAAGDDLLQDVHARVYVADLPPKYNMHIMAIKGCEDGRFLKDMLANPLGPLFESSLDLALYR